MSNDTPKESNLESNIVIESIQTQQASIAKEAMRIGSFTQLKNVSEALGTNKLALGNVNFLGKGAVAHNSQLKDAFESVLATNGSLLAGSSIIERAKEAMGVGLFAESQGFLNPLKAINPHQSQMEKMKASLSMGSFAHTLQLNGACESVLATNASLLVGSGISERAREAMSVSSHLQFQGVSDALKAINLHQSQMEKMKASLSMGSFAHTSQLKDAFERLFATNASLLVGSNYISEMADIVSDIDFDALRDEVILEEEFDEAVVQFTEIENPKNLIDVFSNIKPWIQIIFLRLFVFAFIFGVDIAANVAANILTPYVQDYLEENLGKGNRQKVNDIKTIGRPFENIDTSGLRFITADIVMLRTEPSIKSEIKDELTIGQIVTVLDKKKNWIKVMYQYEEGELIDGWVFTRYTHKFEK